MAIDFSIGGEVTNVVQVFVDYSQSLEQMIGAAAFNEVDWRISSKNFRLEGEGVHPVTLSLVRFIRKVGRAEAATLMLRKSYRSARIEELLALTRKQPNLQRRGPIVALGSGCIIGDRR